MWALVDCDNFFCSCERVFRPDLNGRPLVVLSNNDGCVVARTAETKAMGIKMGLPYFQLLEQYSGRGIVAFSSNYELYGDMSARVMGVLREAAPAPPLQYSIDECFVDLSDMHGASAADIKAWGEALAARVRKWTGIPVSIGIAPTKTLAKVASRFAKRYAGYRKCCVIATEAQRVTALQMFDVADVWGVGRRLARSMASYGIDTALDFANRPKAWVRAKYHVTGERTWAELNGTNAAIIDSMDMPHKSIMTSRSFPGTIADYDVLSPHVANYAARCAAKLRRQHSVSSQLTVFVQSNHFREDLPQYDAAMTATFATATASTPEIVALAMKVLARIFRPGIRYKRAGVMVADIVPDTAVQLDLFTFDASQRAKFNSVSAAIDAINARLGTDTVTLGAQQYSERDADGRSIRFSQAVRRSLKSPDYSTRLDQFTIL